MWWWEEEEEWSGWAQEKEREGTFRVLYLRPWLASLFSLSKAKKTPSHNAGVQGKVLGCTCLGLGADFGLSVPSFWLGAAHHMPLDDLRGGDVLPTGRKLQTT